MKLWLLRPVDGLDESDDPWEPWYNKTFGFVIRAETEEDARRIANENGGSETGPIMNLVYRTGGDPWLNPKYSHCTELTPDGEAAVILEDYRSA